MFEQQEGGLSAQDSLTLIDDQRARVVRALDIDPVVLYGAWGTAWTLGFALFGLSTGEAARVPLWVAGAVFAPLMAAAAAVTAVQVRRARRGIIGSSALVGALYGWSWVLGFAGLAAVVFAVVRLTHDQAVYALLWPAGSGLVTGLIYMMGAALWREPHQFALGAWVLLTSAAGALLGVSALYWVMSLAGGGGFLLSAAAFALRRRSRGGTRAQRWAQ